MELKRRIEINCDMGEVSYESGKNIDKLFMPYIDACNIATGAHAGDLETIVKTLCYAKLHKVSIGIHPSYVDRENFGRKSVNESIDKTITSPQRQIDIFKSICDKLEYKIDHIKAHGALYHDLHHNKHLAESYFKLIQDSLPGTTIYGMSDSEFLLNAQKAGFVVMHEVFADRKYCDKKILAPRDKDNALISDEIQLLEQLKQIVQDGGVMTEYEGFQHLPVDTICFHSDTPNALSFAKLTHQFLKQY